MKKSNGKRQWFLFLACATLFTACGCPRTEPEAFSYRYQKLVGDESEPRYDIAVKCSSREMYDIVVSVGSNNRMPRESGELIKRRTWAHLLANGRVTREDKTVLYGWYEGRGYVPVWGHLLIIKYDRGTESSYVKVIKQIRGEFGSRGEKLFDFDWISALQNESRKRGHVVL